jgi:hypothetical protein
VEQLPCITADIAYRTTPELSPSVTRDYLTFVARNLYDDQIGDFPV